jgi:hypothetical protein
VPKNPHVNRPNAHLGRNRVACIEKMGLILNIERNLIFRMWHLQQFI